PVFVDGIPTPHVLYISMKAIKTDMETTTKLLEVLAISVGEAIHRRQNAQYMTISINHVVSSMIMDQRPTVQVLEEHSSKLLRDMASQNDSSDADLRLACVLLNSVSAGLHRKAWSDWLADQVSRLVPEIFLAAWLESGR